MKKAKKEQSDPEDPKVGLVPQDREVSMVKTVLMVLPALKDRLVVVGMGSQDLWDLLDLLVLEAMR